MTLSYSSWNEKNYLTDCPGIISLDDILFVFRNYSKDIEDYERKLDRQRFPLVLEPVAPKWQADLARETQALPSVGDVLTDNIYSFG